MMVNTRRDPGRRARAALVAAALAAVMSGDAMAARAPQSAAATAWQRSPSQLAAPAQALRGHLLTSRADPDVLRFYALRNYQPAWTAGAAGESQAGAVRAFLARAGNQGLRTLDYASQAARPAPGATAAAFDVALTRDLLVYARDVRTGRVRPETVYRDAKLPPADFDAAAASVQALERGALRAFIAGLAPPHAEYRRLAAALARYRDIQAAGGWPRVTATSDAAILVQRLAAEDSVLATIPNPTPAERVDAIKRYQARNGLAVDGLVAGETLAALNVPLPARIAQIAANMERWRWVPGFERRYIAVNVPAQRVDYMRDGRAVFSSRVIIGKGQSPTPILRTSVEAVVANPPWNIPGDIAARQLLPELRQDANYLRARNMVLFDGPADDPHGSKINWRKVPADGFPYRIRQLPGPDSALGTLMLDMPNAFDVYLHDTPGKALFRQSDREISNGCVRVEGIFALASLALSNDETVASDLVKGAIAGGDTRRLRLDEPLPVYLLYWTAIADEDGTVGFRPDRYGRDAPLIAALDSSRDP
jgi:murein L,D-transpeptidase YcbB/YkuD